MQNPHDIISRIGGALWPSRWDLRVCYWQIPLSKQSQAYTAFKTQFGTFSYRVLPMSLSSSSSTCQILLEFVLQGTHRYSWVLVDDIITYSKTFNEHLGHMRIMRDWIRKPGLTLHARKCHVTARKLNIFRFEISSGKVTPDDSKIQAVKNWTVPTTRK